MQYLARARLWRHTLNQPTFWRAGRVLAGRFDTLNELVRHLHRFRDRHPQLRELHWRGHLHGRASYRSEEHLLQPLLMTHWHQLRWVCCCKCHATCAAPLTAWGDPIPNSSTSITFTIVKPKVHAGAQGCCNHGCRPLWQCFWRMTKH